MVDKVIEALVASKNEAADDVLLEALRLGAATEQPRALEALLHRKTHTGIFGLLLAFDALPNELRLEVVRRSGDLYHLLPEAARSDNPALRAAAMRIVALGRIGRLSYTLSENLHYPDDTVATAAADALVSLSRHVVSESRRLQMGKLDDFERKQACHRLLEMRGDIEAAVYRALDLHKGAKAQDLLRAALLLCDHAGSKALAVLSTSRHGGVSPMVKRLQQTPDAEHVDAFLLGATHGQLRSQFATAFSHIENGPVLDGLLRRTYFLKDLRMEVCMKQVTRGAWWSEPQLVRDIPRRDIQDSAKIADWIAVSGTHDVVQDEKLLKIHESAGDDLPSRIRLLRLIVRRPKGASLTLLRRFLDDPDETVQRIATREIVRRKPADYSTLLLGLMKTGSASVKKVASRAISAGAFDNFYERFDKLDPGTRQRAGRAVFKLLPDAVQRLARKMTTGTIEGRLKALMVCEEVGAVDSLRDYIVGLTSHENAKLRSKAVAVAASFKDVLPDLVLEKALNDPDARVRANAIEVLDGYRRQDYVPMLAKRAQSTSNRERANAIKALVGLKIEVAAPQLVMMLRDPRPEHRISALWASRHVGIYRLLTEIARIAREEPDPKVKRYALASARVVAAQIKGIQLRNEANAIGAAATAQMSSTNPAATTPANAPLNSAVTTPPIPAATPANLAANPAVIAGGTTESSVPVTASSPAGVPRTSALLPNSTVVSPIVFPQVDSTTRKSA